MRRGATVLVVIVVAAIAVAAGFDALRGGSGQEQLVRSQPEPPATSTQRTLEPVPPPGEELAGVLYYTDQNCRLRAAELPDLAPAESPTWSECRFVLSPDGQGVSGAGSGWDPSAGRLRARLFQSRGGSIQVAMTRGPAGKPFRGQAPAWRPDGTLTYFADGAVRAWPSGRVVISRRQLVRAVRGAMPFEDTLQAVSLREAAWLDDGRLAAILSTQVVGAPAPDLLAVYEDGRLASFSAWEQEALSGLRASPQGTYVAAGFGGGGVVILDAFASEIETPPVTGYRAIAWSPDDRWAAVAADDGIRVFQPGDPGAPVRQLDIDAHDLDWRGEPGPPTPVESDVARGWLGGVGGTGRLLVTVPGCRLRALRVPDLVWEEEPDAPAPCRFTLTPNDAPLDEAVSVSPTGQLRAICEGGGLRVFQGNGFRAQLTGACGPAWMGDGTLTFVRNGGLWQGIEDAHALISQQEVSEIFGRPSALEEVAWMDDERFWAVVRSGESAIVALMTADGLVFSPSFTTRAIEDLRVSASGMVAARTDQGVVLFDSGGRRALTFPNGHAVAWAPGELYAAVATPGEVLFVAPVSREVVSVSLEVRDLEWVVP